jgi:hypothetical protein
MSDLNNDLIERLIPRYQKMFRILEKWDIQYEDDGVYGDQCWHNNKTRIARIYPVTVETNIDDYVFHEILHICQSELRIGGYKNKREKEEMFVQDLCKIMYESKNYK